jgi:hypothetical protein
MALITEKKENREPSVVEIDWTCEMDLSFRLRKSSILETQLSREITLLVVRSTPISEIIVFTGSTGYIGSGIPGAFVEDSEIKTILCIAVHDLAQYARLSPLSPFSPKLVLHEDI